MRDSSIMSAVLAVRCRNHTNHEHLGFVLAEKARQRAAGIANEFYQPTTPINRNVMTPDVSVMQIPWAALALAAVFWAAVAWVWWLW